MKLLILGGTAEAADLGRGARARFGEQIRITTSLAGRLAQVPVVTGHLRIGPFGGTAGLVRYLADQRIDAVIDATHPFAAVITAHAVDACAETGVPLLILLRPEWQPQDGDCWVAAADFAEAAALLPGLGDCAFLTTGPGNIDAFAHVDGVRFLVRMFQAPEEPLPLPAYDLVITRPPFTVNSEMRLMRTYGVRVVVTKNSGGMLQAKLDAARQWGLPVVMIRRPSLPPGLPGSAVVSDVHAALDWLSRIPALRSEMA